MRSKLYQIKVTVADDPDNNYEDSGSFEDIMNHVPGWLRRPIQNPDFYSMDAVIGLTHYEIKAVDDTESGISYSYDREGLK